VRLGFCRFEDELAAGRMMGNKQRDHISRSVMRSTHTVYLILTGTSSALAWSPPALTKTATKIGASMAYMKITGV
jgi:hypothetical protein